MSPATSLPGNACDQTATAKVTLALGPAFEPLVSRFCADPEAPLALAVSGGSDSTALLYLMTDWASRSDRNLIVLTVDHGLRSEAAAEAAHVKHLSTALGHKHQTLIWTKPRAGQNAARDARHRLLAHAAKQAGAAVLLLGHTLDDVIETIHIRRRRGTAEAFLAGPMLAAPSPVWPEGRDCTLLRPLIMTRRDDLRAWLTDKGRSWIEDPSNENTDFERIEVRKSLAEAAIDEKARVSEALDLLNMRASYDQLFGDAIRDHVVVQPSGLVEMRTGGLPDGLQARLAALVARVAGGHDRTPRAEPVRAMLDSLLHPGARATLGGAWFQKAADGLWIGRDPVELNSKLECDLWDGRYTPEVMANLMVEDTPFLLRQSLPPSPHWRPILGDRLALEQKIYQTPLFNPVQR
ncbi:MAG: tRNA lysidine(34) synthetase TilS [Pseudomonadota bacterium]